MTYKIWAVKKYSMEKNEFNNFIEKKVIYFDDIEEICDELKYDNSYHFRIQNNNTYILIQCKFS